MGLDYLGKEQGFPSLRARPFSLPRFVSAPTGSPGGMDGKNFSSGQQAQQAKLDALSPDQGTLTHNADSVTGKVSPVNGHEPVDMNMEAAISADDVMRAGGFGAKDDIGSLLPTAMDFTDFEASLRDARDFEDEQEKQSHLGLGYKATEADGGSKPVEVPPQ